MKKIVSIILALTMVIAIAVPVFADAPVIREGDINFTVSNAWWEEIPAGDMFSSEEVNDVSKIVITSDEGLLVVYSNLDNEWTQTPSHVTEFTVDFADVTKEVDGKGSPYVKLYASSAEGTEFNIHYAVYGIEGANTDGAATPAESSSDKPAAPATAAPEATAPANTNAPKTGITLAMLPIAIAAAAVVASKKR